MSPKLEKLLEAYDAKLTCPAVEKPQRLATSNGCWLTPCIAFPAQAAMPCSKPKKAASAALAAFRPTDEIEAMLEGVVSLGGAVFPW